MSKDLIYYLKKAVKINGYLSLNEFFTIVLYHKTKGYYSRNNIIGKNGDFVTAPEISQTFGEIIAAWVVLNLRILNINKNFSFCELGPGKGTLMTDIITTIKKVDNRLFKKVKKIFFLEKSNQFKSLLKKKFFNAIILEDIGDLPKNFNIVIANEFFDALPLNQYIKKKNSWFERVVSLDKNNNFCFRTARAPTISSQFFPQEVEDGYVFEYSEYFFSITNMLFNNIKKNGGIVLIIDYSKKSHDINGTLFSIKNHRHKNPFVGLGFSDISFKPDFEIIKKIAEINDCSIIGQVTQSFFLQRLGINERFDVLINENPRKKISLLKQKERLISKKQMGQSFDVLAISDKKIKVRYGFE